MTSKQQGKGKRPPTRDTLVRRAIRDSARGPATVAVSRVRIERHVTRGLHPSEVGYFGLVISWLTTGWQPVPVIEETAA